MKRCPKCGIYTDDSSLFCGDCGHKFEDQGIETPEAAQVDSATNGIIFCDPAEQGIAKIGTGYFKHLVFGGTLDKETAVLTDRRVYYQTRRYNLDNSSIESGFEQGIIRIEDISACRFCHTKKLSLLVITCVFALLGLAATMIVAENTTTFTTILVAIFFGLAIAYGGLFYASITKCLILTIPGGSVGFTVSGENSNELLNFQKQLNLAQDRLKFSVKDY